MPLRHSFSARGFLASLLLPVAAAVAQVPPKSLKPLPLNSNVAVRLRDGSLVHGRLERLDTDSVVITTMGGRQAYAVAAVRGLRDAGVAHKRPDGTEEFWYPNANTTRLFFGPTGRTLEAGDGYLADHWVVLLSASIGVTDRLQLGGGTVLIPNTEFWYLLPKVGIIRGETFNLAAGAFYGGIREATGGMAYLVGTYGGIDRNITLGVGQGIFGDDAVGKPLIMAGGELRTSRRTALVTENYFTSAFGGGFLMYGIRFLGEKFTVDLAMMNLTDALTPIGIPYVDFVIKW